MKIYIVVDSEEHVYVNSLYSQSPPDKVLTMQVCMMSSLSATRNIADKDGSLNIVTKCR